MNTEKSIKEINTEFGYLLTRKLNSVKWHIDVLGCVGVVGVLLWKHVQRDLKLPF